MIRSKDARPTTQWIVQQHRGDMWHSERFFQTAAGLLNRCRDVPYMDPRAAIRAFYAHKSVQEAIRALPSYCPQRDEAIVSEAKREQGKRLHRPR